MNQIETHEHKATLRSSVLSRIEGERITPLPRALYIVRNYGFWALWGFSVAFGALATAVLIFTELNVGWEFYEETHTNGVTFFVETLPYMWLAIIAGVVVLGYYNLRSTSRGYKYPLALVVVVGLLMSTVGGIVLHAYGVGRAVESGFAQVMPFHAPVATMRAELWANPERGMYIGEVRNVDAELQLFELETADHTTYTVSTEFLHPTDAAILAETDDVGVIAVPEVGDVVIACRLVPWLPATSLTIKDVKEKRVAVRDRFIAYEAAPPREHGTALAKGQGSEDEATMLAMGTEPVTESADAMLFMATEPVVDDGYIEHEQIEEYEYEEGDDSFVAMDIALVDTAPAAKSAPVEIPEEGERSNPCMELFQTRALISR